MPQLVSMMGTLIELRASETQPIVHDQRLILDQQSGFAKDGVNSDVWLTIRTCVGKESLEPAPD